MLDGVVLLGALHGMTELGVDEFVCRSEHMQPIHHHRNSSGCALNLWPFV